MPHPCQHLEFSAFSILATLVGVQQYHTVVKFPSRMTNEIECFSYVYHLWISFVLCLFLKRGSSDF